MGVITSLFVRKVVRAAGNGVDQEALLRSVGLDPHAEIDTGEMVVDTAYYELLERIAHTTDDAVALPLRAGESMRCDDYGALGLAWKTASNLRASFARVERYWRIWTSVSEYEVRSEGRDAYFILHRAGERRLGLRMSNEASLASAVSISRQVSPESFAPLEVHLKHPAPADTSAHEAYFGCPVIFESELDALLVSAEALERSNRLSDEGITRFLLHHLDQQMRKIQKESTLHELVHDAIAQLLSSGVPTVSVVARRMGLSERTLQRRLSKEGLSFQKLVDGARCELAKGLLVQSDYSLTEIAFLTGFSEQSAFNRAFKRWLDQTPAVYRETKKT